MNATTNTGLTAEQIAAMNKIDVAAMLIREAEARLHYFQADLAAARNRKASSYRYSTPPWIIENRCRRPAYMVGVGVRELEAARANYTAAWQTMIEAFGGDQDIAAMAYGEHIAEYAAGPVR